MSSEANTSNPERTPNQPLSLWRKKTLLVLGMTYPAYSTKYKELVCTGAIDEETGAVVRIYPMPKRYMEIGFKNFQRIEVLTQPNPYDGRPDSIRVDFESVTPLEEIPAKDHEVRRSYLERSPSMVRSVEELEVRNRATHVSLGIVTPRCIDRVHLRRRNAKERAEWYATERKFMDQKTLPLVMRPPKKLDFPEVEFVVEWTCDDERCTGHISGLKSWGIHELYRKLKADPERDAKTKAQMLKMLDLKTRDVFLFVGSFHNHQTTFGVMDVYSAPKRKVPGQSAQLGLFGR